MKTSFCRKPMALPSSPQPDNAPCCSHSQFVSPQEAADRPRQSIGLLGRSRCVGALNRGMWPRHVRSGRQTFPTLPSWWQIVAPATLVLAYAFFPRALPAATWSALNNDLPASPVNVVSIDISPAQSSTLFARSIGSDGVSAIFKSTDGAGTWKVLSNLVGAYALAFDPQDSATVYALAAAGVLKSRDGGNGSVAKIDSELFHGRLKASGSA